MVFLKCGKDVWISRKASIYVPSKIQIGNHVRIDDFCILSGKINLGDYIHISANTAIFSGEEKIEIQDFSTISGRCNLYGKSDDYSGEYLANPMVPGQYTNIIDKGIICEKYTIIGCGSTILPGVLIAEGTAIGAMSLVRESTEPWTIYAGIPLRKLKKRRCEAKKYAHLVSIEEEKTSI